MIDNTAEMLGPAYAPMIEMQYGELGKELVRQVRAGEHTWAELFELIARAERGTPCGECGHADQA